MTKKILFALSIFVMTSLLGLKAFAASCPSLVGDWDVNCEAAYYEPMNGTYGYETSHAIAHITDQDGCLFHANSERLDEPEPIHYLTGAISHGDIRMTGSDEVVVGRLIGRNKMEFSVSGLAAPVYSTVNTALCTAERI